MRRSTGPDGEATRPCRVSARTTSGRFPPRLRAQTRTPLYKRAAGLGLVRRRLIDGNDVLAVYAATAGRGGGRPIRGAHQRSSRRSHIGWPGTAPLMTRVAIVRKPRSRCGDNATRSPGCGAVLDKQGWAEAQFHADLDAGSRESHRRRPRRPVSGWPGTSLGGRPSPTHSSTKPSCSATNVSGSPPTRSPSYEQ